MVPVVSSQAFNHVSSSSSVILSPVRLDHSIRMLLRAVRSSSPSSADFPPRLEASRSRTRSTSLARILSSILFRFSLISSALSLVIGPWCPRLAILE